ncbi:hypothetical protein [Aquimarina rhabdastrellae]
MHIKYENLQSTIKRQYSFKYKPEFSESFKIEIAASQVIPLAKKVFEELEWPIVFISKNSIEAKRKGDVNKLTEKITVRQKASGRIEVHSKTLEGNFFDFGKNSLRTGLFITLFKKLAEEYKESDELGKLAEELEKNRSWSDYEIPLALPRPKEYKKPDITKTVIGGVIISIVFGILIGYITMKFLYIIGIYELGIGIGMGYLFGQLIKKTNYTNLKSINYILGGMILVMLMANLFSQYLIVILESNISGLVFFDFILLSLENGLEIKETNLGWIGLSLSWVFQTVFSFLIAQARVVGIVMNYIVKKFQKKCLNTQFIFLKWENWKVKLELN